MPTGEIAALMVLAALAGGAIGTSIAVLVTTWRGRSVGPRRQRINSLARWLAGQLAMSRTSLSFVAAFRALAAERRDSRYFQLRMREAQRARGDWCKAMGDVERAEAALIVWSRNPDIREHLLRFERVNAESLRAAINGDPADVEALARRLRRGEQAAIEFVSDASVHRRPFGLRRVRQALKRPMRWLEVVVDRWAEAP